jgi:uncharacterized membrane protein
MAKARRDRTHGKDHGSKPIDARRNDSPPDWIVFALALAGVLLTGYLTTVALSQDPVALCAPGSGCGVVQGSRWSTFLRLPIALWGFGLYALIALFAVVPSRAVKRWRRIWCLSLIGLAISVYLTLTAWVALDAVCLWCLLSLALLIVLFVIANVRRPAKAPGMAWRGWLVNNAIVVVALLGALAVAQSGIMVPAENPRLKALAEHLTERDVKFYGAFWCPNCVEQKEHFGRSADRLPYVECSPNGRTGAVAFECVSAELAAYPTWIIRGRKYDKVMTPEELAQRSGFDWDGFVVPTGGEQAQPNAN